MSAQDSTVIFTITSVRRARRTGGLTGPVWDIATADGDTFQTVPGAFVGYQVGNPGLCEDSHAAAVITPAGLIRAMRPAVFVFQGAGPGPRIAAGASGEPAEAPDLPALPAAARTEPGSRVIEIGGPSDPGVPETGRPCFSCDSGAFIVTDFLSGPTREKGFRSAGRLSPLTRAAVLAGLGLAGQPGPESRLTAEPLPRRLRDPGCGERYLIRGGPSGPLRAEVDGDGSYRVTPVAGPSRLLGDGLLARVITAVDACRARAGHDGRWRPLGRREELLALGPRRRSHDQALGDLLRRYGDARRDGQQWYVPVRDRDTAPQDGTAPDGPSLRPEHVPDGSRRRAPGPAPARSRPARAPLARPS